MIELIQKNAWAIIITSASLIITAGTFWVDYKIDSANHEKAGAVKEAELRSVEREIRQIKNLLDQSPSELYDPSRRANLRELEDDARELERELGAKD